MNAFCFRNAQIPFASDRISPLGMVATGNELLAVSDRDRVLRAMADCCAERGYRETTVTDVVERAGVDADEFYALFPGKEDCAIAAINRLVSETVSRVSIAEPRGVGASPEQRRAEMQAIVELIRALPNFARLVLIDARQAGTPRMTEAYRSATNVLALMMERAMSGSGKNGAAARAALGAAEALVRRELVAGRAADLPQLRPQFLYASLVPFVGQEEALRQARLGSGRTGEEG